MGPRSPSKSQKTAGRGGGRQQKQQLRADNGSSRATRLSQSQRTLEPEPEKGAGRNGPAAAGFKKCPPNPVNNIDRTREHKELDNLLDGILSNIEEALGLLQEPADEGETVATSATEILKMALEAASQAKQWAGKANNKAVKSIKEKRKENLREVQKEVLIKNISKNGPVENINKVKDSVLKHLNTEAKKRKMGTGVRRLWI